MVSKYCCNLDFINKIFECVILLILCVFLRVGASILFNCCAMSVVNVSRIEGTYEVPVCFDTLTCIFVISNYQLTVLKLLKNSLPSKQTIQNMIGYLEAVNFLLICFTPYLYNYYLLQILRSSDVELNPGPNLNICHINIRSLSPVKLIALQQEITGRFQIISLSESFLSNVRHDNLEIPGFHPLFRKDRGSHGGGVACYVSSNLIAKRREDLEVPGMECLWLEIRSNNNKFLLCTCYRPPDERYNFLG